MSNAPALNRWENGSKFQTRFWNPPTTSATGLVAGAISELVKRAVKSGDIRTDLQPFDLLRALIGVSNVATGPEWQQNARRLVDILITGSQRSKQPR